MRVGGPPQPAVRQPAAPPPPVAREAAAPKAPHQKDEFTPVSAATLKKPRKVDTEALAAAPVDALPAWKNLSKPQREKVLSGMEKRYGKAFTEQFLAAANDPKLRNYNAWANGPGVGPSEKTLRELGYKPYAPELPHRRSIMNEVWVHPTGKVIYQVYEQKPSKAEAAKASEIQEHWKGITDDVLHEVDDMKVWLDDLKTLDPKTDDYTTSHTELWSELTKTRDDVKQLLADNPDMPVATRAVLEGQLKVLEDLNTQRDKLPQQVEAPDGHSIIVMDKWLYLPKND